MKFLTRFPSQPSGIGIADERKGPTAYTIYYLTDFNQAWCVRLPKHFYNTTLQNRMTTTPTPHIPSDYLTLLNTNQISVKLLG